MNNITISTSKQHPFKIKSIDENGVFWGYASVFNNIDAQNELIQNSAFTHSLSKWRQNNCWPQLLWQHDPNSLIGKWLDIYEDDYGLFVKGQIDLNSSLGMHAYNLMRSNTVNGLSIGFIPTAQNQYAGKPTIITALDLVEISLVNCAANPLAKIIGVKKLKHSPYQRSPTDTALINYLGQIPKILKTLPPNHH